MTFIYSHSLLPDRSNKGYNSMAFIYLHFLLPEKKKKKRVLFNYVSHSLLLDRPNKGYYSTTFVHAACSLTDHHPDITATVDWA